jgi:hypothetical protein
MGSVETLPAGPGGPGDPGGLPAQERSWLASHGIDWEPGGAD